MRSIAVAIIATVAGAHRTQSSPLDRSSSAPLRRQPTPAPRAPCAALGLSRPRRVLGVDLAGCDLAQASTVGLCVGFAVVELRLDAIGQLAGALGGQHDEFEAVVDHFQTIFNGDAGHGAPAAVRPAMNYRKGWDFSCARPQRQVFRGTGRLANIRSYANDAPPGRPPGDPAHLPAECEPEPRPPAGACGGCSTATRRATAATVNQKSERGIVQPAGVRGRHPRCAPDIEKPSPITRSASVTGHGAARGKTPQECYSPPAR